MKKGVDLYDILCPIEPPAHLRESGLMRGAFARRRLARIQLALLSFVSFLCTTALIETLRYAAGEFYTSGFYDYASIVFYDRAFFLSSWQTVLYSLLESLPSIAVLLVIAVALALGWSLRNAILSGKTAFMSLHGTTV